MHNPSWLHRNFFIEYRETPKVLYFTNEKRHKNDTTFEEALQKSYLEDHISGLGFPGLESF